MKQLVDNNVTTIQNQVDYEEKYNKLSNSYYLFFDELKSLQATIQDKTLRKSKIKKFLEALKSQDEILIEFSPTLFLSLVDIIDVYSKDEIKVVCNNEIIS